MFVSLQHSLVLACQAHYCLPPLPASAGGRSQFRGQGADKESALMLSVSQSPKGGARIQEVRTITGPLALPPASLSKQTRCFHSLMVYGLPGFGHNSNDETLQAKNECKLFNDCSHCVRGLNLQPNTFE